MDAKVKSAQNKLWEAIEGSADPDTALPLLQEALDEGAQLDAVRASGEHGSFTPLRWMLQECCESKAPMAKALVLAGSNPLEGALADAITEEEFVICAAMVDACLEKRYTSKNGFGLLEHLIKECPSQSPLGDVIKHALERGAYCPAPQGTTWFHILLENPNLLSATDSSLDEQVGWDICQALLESGADPAEVNAAGIPACELFSARLSDGCQPPQDHEVLRRVLGTYLDRSTPKARGPGRTSRI